MRPELGTFKAGVPFSLSFLISHCQPENQLAQEALETLLRTWS
jgi:hypothetical protein